MISNHHFMLRPNDWGLQLILSKSVHNWGLGMLGNKVSYINISAGHTDWVNVLILQATPAYPIEQLQ